jgi:hypothetical protein
MSRPPHSPLFNNPNNIRWRIQVMKFIIMQFSLRPIFLNTVLKNPLSYSSYLKPYGYCTTCVS